MQRYQSPIPQSSWPTAVFAILTATCLATIFLLMGIAIARADAPPHMSRAQEIRLIGYCNGKLLAAMEEDHFPATGCKWIEGVNYSANGAEF